MIKKTFDPLKTSSKVFKKKSHKSPSTNFWLCPWSGAYRKNFLGGFQNFLHGRKFFEGVLGFCSQKTLANWKIFQIVKGFYTQPPGYAPVPDLHIFEKVTLNRIFHPQEKALKSFFIPQNFLPNFLTLLSLLFSLMRHFYRYWDVSSTI